MSNILISGGTGLIGSQLCNYLTQKAYDVTILTRKKSATSENPKISFSYWDVDRKIIDTEAVKKADHIIHLAGAGVMDKKWTARYKKIILESRTKSAELIISCLKGNEHKVKTFVSASAIGWYGADSKASSGKEGFIETDPATNDFLGETCRLWEASVEPAAALGVRVIKLRTGIVLSNHGGAFKKYKRPVRFGIAAILGNGKQIVSWIHIHDLCRLYCEAIENNSLEGSYNATAPEPVSQKTLILYLAKKLKNRFFTAIHVPQFFLKIIFGKRSIEILKSATVNDQKIKKEGFTFLFPSIESAIDELVAHP
jgi:uncharacterized protein (TIGR01777 family)